MFIEKNIVCIIALLVETFRERKLDASLSKSSDRAAFGT
jgi:hypothetical protein